MFLKSELLGPGKILDIWDFFLNDFLDNSGGMLLNNDQVGQLFDILLWVGILNGFAELVQNDALEFLIDFEARFGIFT
jgi:hypothetical protein